MKCRHNKNKECGLSTTDAINLYSREVIMPITQEVCNTAAGRKFKGCKHLINEPSIEIKAQEAINFIREHEPPDGYFVGFSGGKDSIVTLDLIRRSGVKHEAFYSMTLIDPPEVVKFIKNNYPSVVRVKPKITFWQGIMKYGPPFFNRRWCCSCLKKEPTRANKLKHRIMGIRMEESWRRKKLQRAGFYKRLNVFLYYPVFEWSSADIWEYIKLRELKYPALYDEGFSRLGCVVCPFVSGKNFERNKQRWPGHYRLLEKYLNLYWSEDQKREEPKLRISHDIYMAWPDWRGAFKKTLTKGKERPGPQRITPENNP